MNTPQAGIFAEGNRHHYFLEYRIDDSKRGPWLRKGLATWVRQASTERDGAVLVLGFGPALLQRLPRLPRPAGFAPFREMRSKSGKSAPATQADLWFWVQGPGRDEVFDLAMDVNAAVTGHANLLLDLPGFVYRDSRDLSGFVDGTANPEGDEAREAAMIPAGQTGAGGSVVMTQRWIHDRARLHAMSTADQEAVIGRTKNDSTELPDDEMPPDSHVRRMEIERDGEEVQIFRRSVPYGTVGEHGLYFVAFSAEASRFHLMLDRMYGNSDDGMEDRLLTITRPVTGSFWFTPCVEDLLALME